MERIDELAALIAELTTGDGAFETAIPGLYLLRMSTTAVPRHTANSAVLCVVAQGAKAIHVHDQRHVYDRNSCLVVSRELPLVGQVVEASPARPFLGISLELDFAELGALSLEAGLAREGASRRATSLEIAAVDADVLDALVRMVRLLRTSAQLTILAPLVRRELYYRLLLGDANGTLRQIIAGGGPVQRIGAGIEWLRRHAAEPVRMEDLAREVHMSPSTMHAWFRNVTGMSPLQFQKQLRLQEARRLLLTDAVDAATASRRVGYDSPSQFSREYRRFFGAPPRQDVARLRATPCGLHAPVRHVPEPHALAVAAAAAVVDGD